MSSWPWFFTKADKVTEFLSSICVEEGVSTGVFLQNKNWVWFIRRIDAGTCPIWSGQHTKDKGYLVINFSTKKEWLGKRKEISRRDRKITIIEKDCLRDPPVELWYWGRSLLHCPRRFLSEPVSTPGDPLYSFAEVSFLLEPTLSCTSACSGLPVLNLPVSKLKPQWDSALFCRGQHKESSCSGFSLISSKCGVFEGRGSKGERRDVWEHGSLQEDCKESCKGFRIAWSERKPEVPTDSSTSLLR